MKIFLSYASPDRALVEPVRLALAAQGHDIFFDREDLPPGDEYDGKIRRAIEACDLFIAFLSPDAVDRGSYTLTEIEIAARAWPHPAGRVLPVVLRPMQFDTIPAYLKAVTVLEPAGNVAASVADAVLQIARRRQRRTIKTACIAVAVAGVALLAYGWLMRSDDPDNVPMVSVPAGAFDMGDGDWSPRRRVFVSAFSLDVHEVTVARYANFLNASDEIAPPDDWEQIELQRDGELPIVGVSWHDADAYCRWAGKRLPTEAQWEKAARGTDARMYPWGEAAPTSLHANFASEEDSPYPDGLHRVGAHPAGRSAFGSDDQAGNAAEWVADWFSETFDARDDVRDPAGPPSGESKVLRGGGWRDPPERLTTTFRMFAAPDTRSDDVGFRCARDDDR